MRKSGQGDERSLVWRAAERWRQDAAAGLECQTRLCGSFLFRH